MTRPLEVFARDMADFMPQYMREVFRNLTMASVKDITISHIITLQLLKSAGSCKMSRIAQAMRVSTSAATGIVDRMVRAGFLRRTFDDKDRRIINIEMTAKGKKMLEGIDRQRYMFIMDIFGRIEPREREAFLATMKTIYKVLKEEKA